MRIILIIVLAIFSIYTGWIAWEFGYTSVFTSSLKEHPSTQVLVDLFVMGSLVMGSLVLAIMIFDNQRAGRSFRQVAPFVTITMLAGAIGPLLYFIVHGDLLKSKEKKAI